MFIPVCFFALCLQLFILPQQAHAYFASDFIKQLEGRVRPARQVRTRTYIPTSRRRFTSQRERVQAKSLRVYSTNKYLSRLKEGRISSRLVESMSRSNQVISICREKFPDASLDCFTRNRRIVQRPGVVITHKNVH